MMVKSYFVKHGIREAQIEEFIRTNFPLGDYSRTELQRTPLGIKVVIWTNKPGKIIGRGGSNINEMTATLKERFNLENPQLDVKLIERPDLDAKIVAKQISSAIEKGYNYKKIGNLALKRVMDAGAIGAEIIISGCMGGSMSQRGRFVDGYLKYCGQPAKELVDSGFEVANTKRSTIGVSVKIMRQFQSITGERRETRYPEKAGPELVPKEGEAEKEKAQAKPESTEGSEKKKEKKEQKKPEKKAKKKPAKKKPEKGKKGARGKAAPPKKAAPKKKSK